MSASSTTSDQPHTAQRCPERARGRRWRWLRWSIGALLIVVVGAASVTALLDVRDVRRLAPPGELVELSDGRALHLQVAGEEHVGPTVVLDAGQGLFSPAFAWVQDHLAAEATAVAYDRPGYGWSSPADRPVDAVATATDLHEALAVRGLPGPYVLVGHSLGGHYVRAFAAHHPEDTVGLVLLDPAHEHQFELLPDDVIAEFEQAARMARFASWLARLGLFRLSNPQEEALADLPPAAARDAVGISAMARYWRNAVAEAEAFDALAAAVPDGFGDHPVRIVSAEDPGPDGLEVRRAMDELHRELASRSPQATHHTVPGADHLTLLTSERAAAAISELTLELLEELGQR